MSVLAERPLRNLETAPSSPPMPHEVFSRGAGKASREFVFSRRKAIRSTLVDRAAPDLDAADAFDQSWLRTPERPAVSSPSATLRCADLFCGIGGLSVGLEEAAWGRGLRVDHVLAADTDLLLLGRYEANFPVHFAYGKPIEDWLDGELGEPPTAREAALRKRVGRLDIVLAGPPCQGHSDLNNHTRRDDPRNALILRVTRFAELCRPRSLVIENVPGARHDKDGVIEHAIDHLETLGYAVDSDLVRADEVGVAQKRRRFFLVASLDTIPSIDTSIERCKRPSRSVMWAIEDLEGTGEGSFETSAQHSEENQRRIAYLFANDLHDLPDRERPACHRDKPHSYRAVYGRMHASKPAPTLTVGFGSTGQGRFVHPLEPRTLTPHEAARVQSFPDWFDFSNLRRGQLQKGIGNAVPPTLASAVVGAILPKLPDS